MALFHKYLYLIKKTCNRCNKCNKRLIFMLKCDNLLVEKRRMYLMANNENLVRLTPKKAREIGALGGKKSGQVKRERKQLREIALSCFEQLANNIILPEEIQKIAQEKGKDLSLSEAMTYAMILKAMNGDVNAFNTLRDTAGQKPADRVEVSGDIGSVSADIGDFIDANGKAKKHD